VNKEASHYVRLFDGNKMGNQINTKHINTAWAERIVVKC
jgi:hypothetical protein